MIALERLYRGSVVGEMPRAPQTVRKFVRQILETHHVIDVRERVLFAVIQPQIVYNRDGLYKLSPNLFRSQVFRSLRRRKII